MELFRLPLGTLPPEGTSLVLEDQVLWEKPITEFGIDCRITKPIVCSITILPLEDGYLLRGQLQGEVILPCNRCAEDTTISLDERFEEFEEVPTDAEESDAVDEESRIVSEKGALYLDLAAIAWEQFLLCLPPNPLCRPDCQGLCLQCGKNLNSGMCGCSKDEGDPRLAALRNLTITKKQ